MSFQFKETAPGVHTASMAHPDTRCLQHVAIVENSNGWQLFIGGDLVGANHRSFKIAVAQAQRKLASKRSSTMIRVAASLVLLSVVGGTTVGLTKLHSTGDSNTTGAQLRKAAIDMVNFSVPVATSVFMKSAFGFSRNEQPAGSATSKPIETTTAVFLPASGSTSSDVKLSTRKFSADSNVFGSTAKTITTMAPIIRPAGNSGHSVKNFRKEPRAGHQAAAQRAAAHTAIATKRQRAKPVSSLAEQPKGAGPRLRNPPRVKRVPRRAYLNSSRRNQRSPRRTTAYIQDTPTTSSGWTPRFR